MKKSIIIILLVILVIVIFAGWSFLGNKNKDINDTSNNIQPPAQEQPKETVPQTKTVNVNINDSQFNPAEVTINVGDSVVWTNQDSASHLIISDRSGEISSKTLKKGDSYSHIFNKAGTFDYHCEIHPNMKGKVVVQ